MAGPDPGARRKRRRGRAENVRTWATQDLTSLQGAVRNLGNKAIDRRTTRGKDLTALVKLLLQLLTGGAAREVGGRRVGRGAEPLEDPIPRLQQAVLYGRIHEFSYPKHVCWTVVVGSFQAGSFRKGATMKKLLTVGVFVNAALLFAIWQELAVVAEVGTGAAAEVVGGTGDVNADGALDISDVVCLAGQVFRGDPDMCFAAESGLTAAEVALLREILPNLSIEQDDDGQAGTVKTIRITGCNLQIVNGLGATNGNPGNPYTTDINSHVPQVETSVALRIFVITEEPRPTWPEFFYKREETVPASRSQSRR